MLHLTRCTWHGAVVQMPIQSPYKLIVAAKDGTVVRTVDLAHRRTLTIGRSPVVTSLWISSPFLAVMPP